MRKPSFLAVVLGLAVLVAATAGCSQARCAWQNACTAYKKSCEPLPGPPTTVDPIYDVDCGRGKEPEGHGAFQTPRQGP